ncbi:hypothetical protein Q9966_005353 [Columba livia]|nr:hypothetical protein Q9966_005353 [Columba livia]
MSVTICQSMGFMVSALGIGGIIASTCMDQWSTQDLYNNPVTAVFNYQGLWRTCVRESSGFTECRGYFTILGLPGRVRSRQGQRDGRKASEPFSCYRLVDYTLLEIVAIAAVEGLKEKGGFALFRSEQAGTHWQGVGYICKFESKHEL